MPGALEYREVQAEIRQRQTEIAVTGSRIEESGQGILGGLEDIETALEAPDFDWERIITQVRDVRVMAGNHQAEIENLNIMLAGERETTRRQEELFDKREEEWQRVASERDAENAALKVDNKKIAGQRNVVLVIAISLAAAWAVFIAYKVCRFLKIIPV
jgi:hypothetical protein